MRHIQNLLIVRGAGDLATGVILRLRRAGFIVGALEVAQPTAIRRTVALSEAIYEGTAQVETILARRADSLVDFAAMLEAAGSVEPGNAGLVPILVDPEADCLRELRPEVLIDAMMTKRATRTTIDMAALTVGLGPGFEAGIDVHCVIETQRGHSLGRVYWKGKAEANTGIPGDIGGYTVERVIRAPCAGRVEPCCAIGDRLSKGEPVLRVISSSGTGEDRVLASPFDGVVRGLIRSGFEVAQGFKIADIDPRCRPEHCYSVSDKARAIGGGALEAVCGHCRRI